ncbi:hypothetical protein FBULB1_12570 [Fusarium bulbicola]|nr:hypothetical protein FBULB1_12570 [Fusarium bulbicola]
MANPQLCLRWEGGGEWWLDGPMGSVQFTSEAAVDVFIETMTAGPDAMMGYVLSGDVFPGIEAGNTVAADYFFANWLEATNELYEYGRAGSFLAEDVGADSILSSLVEAGEWLLSLAINKSVVSGIKATAGPTRTHEVKSPMKDTLKALVNNPEVFAKATERTKQLRADRKNKDSSKAAVQLTSVSNPDYSITWWNQTGGERLTSFSSGISPRSIMYIHSMPASEFKVADQSLSWSWALGGFDHGPMNGWGSWKFPNGHWFGVNVHCPAQFLWIGTAPYYEVCWSEADKSNWHNPVDDPSIPFSFPTSLGYNISLKTACDHTSISVTVFIQKIL